MTYANRGKWLENAIISANRSYLNKGLANIQNIPVDKGGGYKGKTFYKQKSTVDFIGISKYAGGGMIAFDAKETKNKSFPFANVHEHQVAFMLDVVKHGGTSFLLILFKAYNELYRIDVKDYIKAKREFIENGRKSIPYQYFRDNVTEIHSNSGIIYDYLNIGHLRTNSNNK